MMFTEKKLFDETREALLNSFNEERWKLEAKFKQKMQEAEDFWLKIQGDLEEDLKRRVWEKSDLQMTIEKIEKRIDEMDKFLKD